MQRWSAHGVAADLSPRAHLAQCDAWQAEGRLRAPLGGGCAELPGVRLMSSGLPHRQWNHGDVLDAARVDLDAVGAWFATRAHGAGVPWGLRVPARMPFEPGQRLLRKRCMALLPTRHRRRAAGSHVQITTATAADLDTVVRIDAAAFEVAPESMHPWVAPQLEAPGFTIALALLDGEPAGIATAKLTDGLAGPCVGIFGVGVLGEARRRGIGSALTQWLLERAWAAGATLAHLNPDSDAAACLYARMGFEETDGIDIYSVTSAVPS